MHQMNLKRLDLNLLVVLEALFNEKTVTGAAQVLGLSQPAASHALTRLRAALNDPLFVREGRLLVATAYARAIEPMARESVRTAREILSSATHFDPATAQRAFRISAQDYVATLLSSRFESRIRPRAPHIKLQFVSRPADTPTFDLLSGRLDVAIGLFDSVPAGLAATILRRESFVGVVRKGLRRPNVRTLDGYCALPHVLVSPRGGQTGLVDVALDKVGRRRNVLIQVQTFLAVPLLVATNELVATVPRGLMEIPGTETGIRIFEPPVAVEGTDLTMLIAQGMANSPAHRWMTRVFGELLGD